MAVDAEQIEQIVRATADLYRAAEQQLLELVTGYLAKGIDAPGWATERLAAVNQLRRDAEVILTQLGGDASGTIAEAVAAGYRTGQAAAMAGVPPELAAQLAAPAGVATTVTSGTAAVVENLAAALTVDVGERHSNVLRHVTDVYRRVIAEAAAVSVAGGRTRREASQHAYQRFVDQGVTSFTDVSGRRWRLSSYVEMAVRTVTARAAVQGQTDRLERLGQDLVIVSNEAQECIRCRPYEGEVLRITPGPTGKLQLKHATSAQMVTVDVKSTLAAARAAGLQHPNCRHVIRIYLPGVTKRPDRPTADPEGDKARQRQREIERSIRRWKERDLAALDPVAKKAAKVKVRAWQQEMRDHLDANPKLKRLPYREQIGAGNTPTSKAKPAPKPTPPKPFAERLAAATTGRDALAAAPRSLLRGEDLTGDQQSFLRQYKGTAYDAINGQLRREQGKLPGTFGFDFAREAVSVIDGVMARSPLTKDVSVRRGIKVGSEVFGDAWAQLLTGAEWTEHGYMSTTVEAAVPNEFRDPRGAILHILVPAGTHGIELSDVGYEGELLLERGLKLRVVSDTGPGEGRVIEMEVVP